MAKQATGQGSTGGDLNTVEVAGDRMLQAAALEAVTRAEIDQMRQAAIRSPRSIEKFIAEATSIGSLSEKVADSCWYQLERTDRDAPGGKKIIEGPTIRLAEIVVSTWRNLYVATRITEIGDRMVTAEAVAMDIERNTGVRIENRRRITKRDGTRFNDDMIMITCNAAKSFAMRDAIFRVVPTALIMPIYESIREVSIGTADTLGERREKMVEHFKGLGIEESKIWTFLGIGGVNDVTLPMLAKLKGIASAIKNGEVSIGNAFDLDEPGDAPAGGGAADAANRAVEAARAAGGAKPKPEPDPKPAGGERVAGTSKPTSETTITDADVDAAFGGAKGSTGPETRSQTSRPRR